MNSKKLISLVVLCVSLFSCIDAVTPEFNLEEGLVFVEAFATDSPGTSFVTISESVLVRNGSENVFISNAEVYFVNSNTGEKIRLLEQEDVYVPPNNFVVSVGDSWELDILLADGRSYKSKPETVLSPVEISSLETTYNPQLDFREDSDSFVPGHSISVTFDDPMTTDNFYYWRFKSFERIADCFTCRESVLRDGTCVALEGGVVPLSYYTYSCDSNCWRLRSSEDVQIFEDEFTNGSTISKLPIANVFLYTKQDILVEIEQFSLTPSAFEYYRILKDIVDNNSGFNAPPPAALVGNMFNPDDDNEFVLGRFTAAATTKKSVFINRSGISEQAIEPFAISQSESSPPIDPREIVAVAPCTESLFRTSIQPEGWPVN